MSSQKGKKSRIQGGWANFAGHRLQAKSNNQVARHYGGAVSIGTQLSGSSRNSGEPEKPVENVTAVSAVSSAQPKFTFQPDAIVKKEPVVKTISASGRYILSTEPSGTSSIQLIRSFIEHSECEWLFDQVHSEVPWKQQEAMKAGQTYLQPRLTAWFGEHPYSYSGLSHEQNEEWTPVIRMLKDRITEVTGYEFNSVLANLYRDGHDLVSWHSDDEVSLGIQPLIASLSFGDTRVFELRKKPPSDIAAPDDLDYPEYIKISLDAGSLLIMDGCLQQDWQHRVPKEYHDRGPRINLTYRTILPPS